MDDVDVKKYKMKYETESDLVDQILHEAKVPSFSFEEPFSHNVTSMSKCLRQRWYQWKKTEPIYHPNYVKKDYNAWGPMGNMVEEHLIDLVKKSGLYRGEQIRVKQVNPNISGAIDLMIELDGKFYPVEIKSSKESNFLDNYSFVCPHCRARVSERSKSCRICHNTGITPIEELLWTGVESEPSFDHYCQLQMYLYMATNSGLILNDKMLTFDLGYLWYYNKNNGDMVTHKVWYDDLIIEWLLARCKAFDECLKTGEEPPRSYDAIITSYGLGTKSDWQCRFCDWQLNCWSDEILKKNPFFKKWLKEKEDEKLDAEES